MPSGDSSPWLGMNPGHKLVEAVHGDESPDGINAVPTLVGYNQPLWISTEPLPVVIDNGARGLPPT
jgi:hypothetical protein